MSLLRKLCPPEQSRVLCSPLSDKQIKAYKKNEQPYIYNPKLPIVANTVGPLSKKMAEAMGFEDWERCTGHGLRKMGITHAMTNTPTSAAPLILKASRHKNHQTSLLYQQPTDEMFHNYDRAIRGEHAAPPAKKQLKKKKKKDIDTDYDSDNKQSMDSGEFDNSNICYDNEFTSGTSIASSSIIPPSIHNNKDSNSTVTDISSSVNRDTNEENDKYPNPRQSYFTSIVTPHIPAPKEIATCIEPSIDSGRVSSLTGQQYDNDSIGDVMPLMPLVSHVRPDSSSTMITPHYNMMQPPIYNNNSMMHHVQLNIMVQPPINFLPVGMPNPMTMEAKFVDEQQKHLSNKVKELELQLSYEKKTKEEIFKTLRESKGDGKKL